MVFCHFGFFSGGLWWTIGKELERAEGSFQTMFVFPKKPCLMLMLYTSNCRFQVFRDPATLSSTLVGVVTGGVGCGSKRFPGLYADVAAHREWIREHTGI